MNFESLCSAALGQPLENLLIGNHLSCYVGHSTNETIRHNSASGGIATQLLVYAMEKGLIDGALVARARKDNPLLIEGVIAKTTDDVIAASKSKYCPVAVNTGLREILKENGRYAVVGLPCHIHGIRKAEQVFKILKKRIILHIGLLCSHMVSYEGVDLVLSNLHIPKESVTELNYRGEGWPGSMSIKTANGAVQRLPLMRSWHAYWPVFSSFFFTPMRCTMCPDQAAELADVSLGDAWLPEFKRDKSGESIIVVRTKAAHDFLAALSRDKVMQVREVEDSKLAQSQMVNLILKKKDLGSRLSTLHKFGLNTPKFIPKPRIRSSPFIWLRMMFMYGGIRTSNCQPLRPLLVHVPFPVFRAYYGVYKYLSKI